MKIEDLIKKGYVRKSLRNVGLIKARRTGKKN